MKQMLAVMMEDSGMKLAWLHCRKGKVMVLETAVAEFPDVLAEKRWISASDQLGEFLYRLVGQKKGSARAVVFCLPSRYVLTRELSFPEMKEEQIRMALRFNGKDYFPVDLERCALAVGMSRREKGRLSLTVAAVPDEMVRACDAAAKAAGFRKTAVVSEQSAIAALAAEQMKTNDGLAVWMEEERSFLMVFRNGRLLQQRTLECSPKLLPAALKRMREEGKEPFSGDAIEQAYLFSEIEDDPFCFSLEEALETPVKQQRWTPAEREYAANTGAALAKVRFLSTVEEETLRKRKKRERCRILLLAAALSSLLVITPPLLEYFTVASEVLDWKNRLLLTEAAGPDEEMYDEAMRWREIADEVEQITESDRMRLPVFLEGLNRRLPESFSLESFSYTEEELLFSACADGKQSVADLLKVLEEMDGVSDVRLGTLSSVREEKTERVFFSVSCCLGNGKEEP